MIKAEFEQPSYQQVIEVLSDDDSIIIGVQIIPACVDTGTIR